MDSAQARYRLAQLWQLKGRRAKAAAGYEAAIRLEGGFLPAWMAWIDLLLEDGRPEAARAVCRQALERLPGEAVLLRYLDHTPGQTAAASGHPSLLLWTDCSGLYGVGQINHLLASGVRRAGWQVTCARPAGPDPGLAERSSIGVGLQLVAADDLYSGTRSPRSFGNADEVTGLLSSIAPDIVLFSDGCPFSNLAAKEAAQHLGVPYVVVVHTSLRPALDHALPRLVRTHSQAAAVVAVSADTLDCLHRTFGFPGHRGQVIYNSRPDSYFGPPDRALRDNVRASLGIPAEAVLVFTAAAMEARKGYHHQIRAIQILGDCPSLRFAWAGSGTLEPQVRAEVARLGLPVQCLGERTDVAALLEAADVFVLPSSAEGMPLAVLEAMARGLPVAATAVNGTPEALAGTGALLHPERIATDLSAILRTWIDYPEERFRLGSAARERAHRLFRADRMVSDYLAILTAGLRPLKA